MSRAFFYILAVSCFVCGLAEHSSVRSQDPGRPIPKLELAFLKLSGGNSVNAADVSPDGKTLATGGACGRKDEIVLWDIKSGAVRKVLQGHDRNSYAIFALAYSPDGETLAAGSGNKDRPGEVLLWNVATESVRHRLIAGNHYVKSLRFIDAGRTLVTFTMVEKQVRFWDVATGQQRRTLKLKQMRASAAAFSADGKWLATGGANHYVYFQNMESQIPKHVWRHPESWVHLIAISPDGKIVAARATGAGSTFLWDTQTGALLRKLPRSNHPSYALAFSPDSKLLAESSKDVMLWNVATGKQERPLQGAAKWTRALRFTSEGSQLIGGSADGSISIWDVKSGVRQRKMRVPTLSVPRVLFSPDGRSLATIYSQGWRQISVLRIWDAGTGRLCCVVRGPDLSPKEIFFTPDSKRVLIWGQWKNNHLLGVWDAITGKRHGLLADGLKDVKSVALAPDGRTAAVAFRTDNSFAGKTVKTGVALLDSETGKVQRILSVKQPQSVVFSPDGKLLAVADRKSISLWPTAGGTAKILVDYKHRGGAPFRIDFSPNGQTLAVYVDTGSRSRYGGRFELWNVATAKCLRSEQKGLGGYGVPFFSPDGKLVSERYDYRRGASVALWDLQKGELEKTIRVATRNRIALAFSPKGDALATGTSSPVVCLWDRATGRLRATLVPLPPMRESISRDWVAFTPEGYYDGSAKVASFLQWRVGQQLFSANRFSEHFQSKERVQKALQGK